MIDIDDHILSCLGYFICISNEVAILKNLLYKSSITETDKITLLMVPSH